MSQINGTFEPYNPNKRKTSNGPSQNLMNTQIFSNPQIPYPFFDPNLGSTFQGQQFQQYVPIHSHRPSRVEDLQLIDTLKQEIAKLTFLVEEKDYKIQELNQKLLNGQTSNYQETEIANLKKELMEKDVLIGKILSQTQQTTNTSVSAPRMEEMSPVPQTNTFQQQSLGQGQYFPQGYNGDPNQSVNQYQSFQ